MLDNAEEDPEEDYGEPFIGRSFGGEFVWADSDAYTCKILRVRPGQNVIVSTKGRKEMVALLTGGRALLEIREEGEDEADMVELMPASPISIRPGASYKLVAVTEVELFTSYAPADPE